MSKRILIEGLKLGDQDCVRRWIEELVRMNGRELRRLFIKALENKEMMELNRLHLDHHYSTDVITFDYSEKGFVLAEIFVCPEVALDNAKEQGVDGMQELRRLIAHGLLHCMGWNDKDPEQQKSMREAEEEALRAYEAICST